MSDRYVTGQEQLGKLIHFPTPAVREAMRTTSIPSVDGSADNATAVDAIPRAATPPVGAKALRTSPRAGAADTATTALRAVLVEGLGDIERSNAFDEWRETLDTLSRAAIARETEYRQILGFLLAACDHGDVVDYSDGALKAMFVATDMLRRPRLIGLDVRLAKKKLREAGLRIERLSTLEGISVAEEDRLLGVLDRLLQTEGEHAE